jgi:hypothetical protein
MTNLEDHVLDGLVGSSNDLADVEEAGDSDAVGTRRPEVEQHLRERPRKKRSVSITPPTLSSERRKEGRFLSSHLEVTPNRLPRPQNPRDHLPTFHQHRPDQIPPLPLIRQLPNQMHQVRHIAQHHLHQRRWRRLGHLVSARGRGDAEGEVVGEDQGGELEGGEEELVEDGGGFDGVGEGLLGGRAGGRVGVGVGGGSEGEEESAEGAEGAGLRTQGMKGHR